MRAFKNMTEQDLIKFLSVKIEKDVTLEFWTEDGRKIYLDRKNNGSEFTIGRNFVDAPTFAVHSIEDAAKLLIFLASVID